MSVFPWTNHFRKMSPLYDITQNIYTFTTLSSAFLLDNINNVEDEWVIRFNCMRWLAMISHSQLNKCNYDWVVFVNCYNDLSIEKVLLIGIFKSLHVLKNHRRNY